MFCRKCGTKNPKEARFCRHCGNNMSKEKSSKSSVTKQKEKNIGLILIEIILWIVAGIVLLNFFNPLTENVFITVIIKEGVLLTALGYIRRWHNSFGLAIGGTLLMTAINIFSTFSLIGAVLFGLGIIGLYISKMNQIQEVS